MALPKTMLVEAMTNAANTKARRERLQKLIRASDESELPRAFKANFMVPPKWK
jgi:hypothetical protein